MPSSTREIAYYQITQTIGRNGTRTHRDAIHPIHATSPAEELHAFLNSAPADAYTVNPDGSVEHTSFEGARVRVWWERAGLPIAEQAFNVNTVDVNNIVTVEGSREEFVVTAVRPDGVIVRPVTRPTAEEAFFYYGELSGARTAFFC